MAQVSRYWPVSNWGYFSLSRFRRASPKKTTTFSKKRRTPPQTLLVVLLLLCLIICPAARAQVSGTTLPVPSLMVMMVISLNSLAPFFLAGIAQLPTENLIALEPFFFPYFFALLTPNRRRVRRLWRETSLFVDSKVVPIRELEAVRLHNSEVLDTRAFRPAV